MIKTIGEDAPRAIAISALGTILAARTAEGAPELYDRLNRTLANAEEITWVQEEPANAGAWSFLRPQLAQLLGRLAQIETPQPKWVRFLYAYPNRVTSRLLETLAAQRDRAQAKRVIQTLAERADTGAVIVASNATRCETYSATMSLSVVKRWW